MVGRMRGPLRPCTLLLMLVLVAALAFPVGSGAAPTGTAHAAKKLKRCKTGANAKKCRCPKGQKLVKSHRKYRCKKKKAPPIEQGDQTQGDNTNTDPGTGTGTTTDPGTGTGSPPTQTGNGAQTERDDAGYTAALLAGSRFGPRTDESNSGGIYTYTYDFCSSRQFNLRSEYYNSAFGQTLDTNYGGTWELEQGYKVLQSPNGAGWAGILVIRENDGSAS